MQADIVRTDGDLKREVWDFDLSLDFGSRNNLRLTRYCLQTKVTKRHGWKTGDKWERYSKQFCNIANPPLPADVVQEAKDYFKAQIDKLEVTR